MDILQILITLIIWIIWWFIGSIVWAWGTITIPFLMFLGIPPASAIATERFASLGVNISTIKEFVKNKKVIWKYFIPFTLIALLSTILNTFFVISLPENIIKLIIIFLMIIWLFVVIKFPKIGLREKNVNKKYKILGYISFWISNFIWAFIWWLWILKYIVISFFFGTTYIKANASQRLPWAISIFITTIFLLIKWFIIIPLGISLFIGNLIGWYVWAITQIKKWDKWVRIIFIVVIIISIIKSIIGI